MQLGQGSRLGKGGRGRPPGREGEKLEGCTGKAELVRACVLLSARAPSSAASSPAICAPGGTSSAIAWKPDSRGLPDPDSVPR